MRIAFVFLITACAMVSCSNNDKIPDVSDIKINVTTMRFEKALFTIDTINYATNLDILLSKYPSFVGNFLSTILNADLKWSADSLAQYVHSFTGAYKNVYDTALLVFKDFTPYEKEIKQGLQYVKYYFPNFKDRKKNHYLYRSDRRVWRYT